MVYSTGFAPTPDVPSIHRRAAYDRDDWSSVDWKIAPERLEAPARAQAPAKRGLWGRISRFFLTGLAALTLTGNLTYAHHDDTHSYRMPEQTVHELVMEDPGSFDPAPLQAAASETFDSAIAYRAGREGRDSLWRIADYHLRDSLPEAQPARDQALIAATDALAAENGMCPPSIWHAEHPNAGYGDALACADGSASPHILSYDQRITVGSITSGAQNAPDLEARVQGAELDAPRARVEILDPDGSTLEERASDEAQLEERSYPLWRQVGYGLLAAGLTAAITGLAYAVRRPAARRDEELVPLSSDLDAPFVDPQRGLDETRQGNATLAYGHAYLARKNYLDRTMAEAKMGRRLAGAARSAVERKAARLNRLAAALDTPYVSATDPPSIGDTVRESLGLDSLTDRTAKRYVQQLASLGHLNAQAYLAQMPEPASRPVRAKRSVRMPKVRRSVAHPRLAFA